MSIVIFFELICFIIAFITLIKDANFAWRSMVVFLLITCITEITGRWLRIAYHNNQWLYNIFMVFEAGFTSLMFSSILNRYINSRPLILSGLALLLLLYAHDIFEHGFLIYHDLTATVMSVIFVLYSFYYYFLLINDEQYVDLKRSPPFWWVAGTLFFHFGSTAVNLFFTSLPHVKIAGHNITYFIFTALSIILYSCWSYSFICKKWLRTTSKT